jgi:hypothetical protein
MTRAAGYFWASGESDETLKIIFHQYRIVLGLQTSDMPDCNAQAAFAREPKT